jgi:hypothetical protein
MPVHPNTRASIRAASQEQHERRSKKAYQGTRKGRRHVSGCALTNCSNVRGSAPVIKRELTLLWQDALLELLCKADEKSFGAADVAQPI